MGHSVAGVLTVSINKIMVFLFGHNWRTSFWGLMAIMPQIAKPIQTYLVGRKVSDDTLNLISILFAIIFALVAKDGKVTGGTIQTGGPTQTGGK